MNALIMVLLAPWLAGLTAWLGGLIARFQRRESRETGREVVHGIVAFGGGLLVAAVAFALIPEGILYLNAWALTLFFCAGGIAFCLVDAFLAKRGGSKAQFMAMLMDFLPEAISLGAVFVHDRRLGFLLAAFIGAQNLPEGFNAFREVVATGTRPRSALAVLLGASFLGPVAAALGYFFLQNQPRLTAGIMTFAGGGILYLIFQDIAPQSKMRRHWTPALGAVLGFAVGMLGKKLIG